MFVKDVPRLKQNPIALDLIKSIGWGNVPRVKPLQLEKRLISVLIELWDVPSQRFIINEEEIDISRYVEKVVGVSNCGLDVNREGQHDDADDKLYTALTAGGKSLQCAAALKLLDDETIDK